MSKRFYKILEKGFLIFFYVILAGLFLKGEVFRFHAVTFTSVKNFVLVFIVWWLILQIVRKPGIPLRKAGWLWPVLALGIGSVLFSKYPIVSLKAVYVLSIYILWFYSIWDILREKRHVVNTIFLMIGIAGFVNIVNLSFHFGTGIGGILEKYPFWRGKNAFGLFLVMALCVSGSLSGRTRGINSLLLILGIIFSYSRGAWISGLLTSLGLVIYRFKRLVFVIIGCIVIFLIVSPGSVHERIIDDTNIKERLDLWNNTMDLVKKSPIIGTGLGTFTEAYRDSYPELVPLKGEGSRIIRHAHNLYLQFLIETGVIGLIVFLFLVGAGLVYAIRNFIKEEDQLIKSIRYGSLLGIAAFLLYSITDCTTSWRFIGDSFSHINLIWILLWAIVLRR